ncbi:MAG: TrmH family RNA methyltransferase, partial [Pseudomonadota bacterium]
ARASGADDILDNATVHASLADAVAGCIYVTGTSARSRALAWPTLEPRNGAQKLLAEAERGPVAAVFGPEKTGLCNDDMDLCDSLLTIPTDPEFSSLNLAMAVQVLTYEIRSATAEPLPPFETEAEAATADEMAYFYEHLENVLRDVRFLDPDNPRHLMRRLRRLFVRARPDKNELNILRGILTAIDRTRA